ncbi:MAG: nucleotide sugar dehydrogenase [Armatimonadota bacterium]|nr:nucleotide sugar dehydrogenase [Armatimonadota bacterium]MDR7452265.1 nucleotide sugar dehydrogenase [Armatimonadota bacterium]MDR7467971.1 nucleotide sugar dehydrogenase [Armatimonadota bacterium]MDR7494813.1 nucleotide sugar dehydrogenase [Armatimonadota bacterium]MDR7499233.1 nucleotide sugar dehydrogenase [Armatimonadota bacterium]
MRHKICVLGLGYMGLPMAALLATHGHFVVGVDINRRKVELLTRGELTFDEPGLEDLVRRATAGGTLRFSPTIEPAEAFIIAVPTPLVEGAKRSELRYVVLAAGSVASVLKRGDLVVLESTVPPQTTRKVVIPILETSGLEAGADFLVAHCPERAIPGRTLHELVHNDRVIGAIDDRSAEETVRLYGSFVRGAMHVTDTTTAEMVKLMENTSRDINIAMANEFAKIAEEVGVNVWEAIDLANHHVRVNILKPGPGVGGHCIAVDPWFLTENSIQGQIIKTAREINDSMPGHVVAHAERLLKGIPDPVVAVLGYAYKANVGDTRETPAARVVRLARDRGWLVRVHDPLVRDACEVTLVDRVEECIEGSDCVLLLTDHDAYRALQPARLRPLVRTPNLIDTRNLLDHPAWEEAGFTVVLLGGGRRLPLRRAPVQVP